jgi:long-chain acyl-CoA synthetase
MLLHEFLERSRERFPGKTALVSGRRRLTFEEIDSEANRLARALRDAGVAYGDRVVVLLDNSPEAVVSIFGILKGDAVFVALNPTIKAEKLAYILANCRASALVTSAGRLGAVERAISGASSLRSVIVFGDAASLPAGPCAVERWNDIRGGFSSERPPRAAIDIDLASLIYTSGTTGNPKGVMLTHRNMVSASTSITTYLENTERDSILSVLPLSFDYGLYQVLMAAQFGGTVVLEKSFLYPYEVINTLKRERATGFPIVPTISAMLLQLEELKNERFDDLRYITNTAAALPVAHIRGLRKIFPGAKIYSMYGLTECKRVSYLPPEEIDRRPTSVGKGMPNEQVYLVDEDNRVITEPGAVGELVVRGANVMQGYWELPEETSRVLKPGRFPWERVLHTGDLFRADEEGFLYFVSRKDDIIKSRGEKVSPKEVENVIYEHPDVLEAAVIGVPDEVLGEAIKACIVLKEGAAATEKEIVAHCMRHLEDFMVPKVIVFMQSLPKTASGKITKKGL